MSEYDDLLAKYGAQPSKQTGEDEYDALLKKYSGDVQADKPKDTRGIADIYQDVSLGMFEGMQNVQSGIGGLWGLATGDMNNRKLREAKDLAKQARAGMSTYQQDKDKSAQVAVEKAEKEGGFWSGLGEGIMQGLDDPLMAVSRQLPLLAVGGISGGAIKVAAGQFLRQATEKTMIELGAAGAVASMAAMQGSDIGADAYERVLNIKPETWAKNSDFQALIKQGESEDAAKHAIALREGRIAAAKAAAISIASQKLPGGSTLEKVMMGAGGKGGIAGMGIGALKGAAGESLQESIEEGSGQKFSNEAAQAVDPTQSSMQGVGGAAGQGAAVAAILGGTAGGASGFTPSDTQAAPPPGASPSSLPPTAAGASPLAAPPPLNQAVPGATAFPDVNEAIQADELVQADAANPVDRMAELDAESVALAARKRELNDPANGYGPMFDAERAEIFTRQMEIAQERAELELGRTAPQPDRPVDVAPPAAPLDTAAASMDEVRRQNEQRIQRMIDLAASRGDFEPVKTSPTGTPIVGNRPVSSIPSGRIAQVLDATTNPNERIALEQEMARRGMEVPVLVEPAPPVQEIADLPEDNELPAKPAMERGDVSLSGATDNNFDVSGRTDAQLANLVKAGKPGWREAAIAESARRKTASLPVESAARTLGEDGRATDGKPINKGDVFRTLSGRNTTPYPKQKTEKYASQWLIDNATVEAESRGDDFNARMFKNSKPLKDGTLTTADREGMLMYLFSQQPDVVPSILKPLTGQAARTAEVDKTINAKPDEVSAFDQRYPNIKEAEKAIKDRGLKQVAVFKDGDQYRIGAKVSNKQAPSNNLIQRIKQLGGINTRYRSDVIGDKAGAPGLFSGNGKGLDDLATMLQAEGFAIDTDEAGGGVDDLTELIQRAVNGGETIMNHAGQQAAAEKKLNDDFRDNLKEEIAKLGGTPARNASTQKLVEMLNTLREKLRAEVEQESIAKAAQLEAIIGQDLTPAEWDMLLDERNAQAFDYTQDIAAIARMEQEREAANAVEREQEGEGAQTAVQRTGEGPRQGDSTRGDESQAARTEQETFGLTGQTPEEIKAKEDDRAAKAKAEQESADKAEEEAKKKRIAAEVASRQQASAENFQLGQSAEDALAGQGDIFSQPSTTVPAQKAPDSAKPATSTETPAGQPAATTKPTTSTNTVFTEDAAAKARAILKKKLGQLNSGLDPEIMQAGITLAGYHIEKGARTFAAYAKAMIEDLGDAVKPYLKSWYAAVTLDPRAAGMDGMDDLSSVQSADVEAILKETGDTHEPDKHSRANLERDRQDAGTQDGLGEDDVRAGTRRDGGDGEQGVRRTAQTQDQPAGGERVPGHEAAPDGAQGDFSPFAEAPGIEPGVAGSDLDQRSGDLGLFGQTIEPAGTEAADRVATGGTTGLDAKRKAQAAAQNVKTIPGNRENIREALPFLMDGQQDDVAFAEKRFSKPTGYGVLFTNGTGTGKTASGLGVIKRFERQGKTNTLIVVPSDKIAADWIEFAKNLKLDIAKLDDTKDAGQGIVITTYANFGANDALVRRKWDLVVADEAHYLSQAKDGDGTLALDKLRAITMSPRGAHTRFSVLYAKNLADLRGMSEKLRANFSIMNRDDTMDQMVDALRQENRKLEADISTLRAFLDQKRNEVRDEVDAAQGATRPRVTFLSATPFAYEKSIDYAEGYLFDYPADGKVGRSNQDGRSIFMVQHFGYRVRNHKLTEPGPEVNRGLMQRQFNSWLKSEGVLSGRMLDVSMDYDRKFILTESAIGKDIDRAMQWLWDQSNDQTNPNRAGYQTLSAAVHDTFDHLTRRYLLEAIKAKEAIPIIRQHLGMGRKVVVFHDFKKGGGFNPFRFSHSLVFSDEAVDGDDQKKNDQARAMAFNSAIDAFNAEFRELVDSPVWKSASPINALSAAFPDALLFNGDIPPKKRRENVAIFQDDESGKNLIIGQSAAMKEGVSLHDTTGKHPRVLINLGLPTQPTTSIQEEGRIFRVGQASNAIFRYLNTGTNWERWAFATTIAQRSSAAENLALGEEARALMDAYIQGFEESDAYPPGHEGEGTGGKERDRQATEALTEWDRAMTLYFAQHKRTSRDKSMEGVDYFATPEPLGLKMVEWADIRDGDKALEPSAGHGAIARWFPDNINRTVVEPSSELASRLKMVTGDARLLQEQFEQLNTAANKFDAVVMNPPFGVGGKTAIEHVAKAAQHLNNGGRIVALIPTGPAADKRFDKWFYGEEQRAIKPIDTLDYGIGPQEIYRGDAIKTNASWAPEAIILRKDAGGQSYWVKVEGRAGEIMVNKAAVTAHARSGPRTETFRPAESLYLRADIKLPQVTFERAGTRVAARVVVIEKQTNKDVAGNIQQINRDYTGSDDIKSFFERIKDAGIPERAAAHAPDSSAPATPAHTAQAVQGAMTGFKLAQTKHAIKGIDLFVATLEKKVEYDEYKRIEKAAKKHGGYYSNFARNGAVPGFQFETEENRKAFLDGFNKAEEPAATYISMAEKGQSPTGGTLLSRDDSGSRSIPWYSPLHRAVGSAKRDAMPGQQWKLWLQGNKSQLGLKDDELTYSGVLDYLELRGKEKVTKAEIADYLSGNGVTVQDVVKGGDRERFAVRRNPSSGGWQVRDPDGNWWGGYATEEDARAAGHNDIAENPTKFSGYWDSSYKGGIPGTYREILVTLPEREAAKVDDDGQISFTPEKNNAANFRSSHWDEPNVLVHVRLDEVTGADGKRYVRVGEVQSDWGQKGKKEGFAKPGDASLLLEQKELRNKKDSITARWGGLRGLLVATKTDPDAVAAKAEKDAIDVRLREIEEALGNTPMTGAIRGAAPPSAPFVTDTKAWVALGIKRAIMHAMDVGADGVVFGTGEQNANLYDLSKQVDRLDIEPYGIEAGVQQYRVTAMKDAAKAIDRTVAEHDLENVVGKDIAKEAIAGKTRFEGEGLRVGGEGMRAFYDQIVPQVANEVLKKIGGGKVGAVDTRPSDPNELGRWMQPGFLLPESLRTKLSENGLSLFARQPGTKGKSISLRDLTAVRDRVAARMKNLPPVHVFASPDSPGVPGNLRAFIYQQGAQNDVEGALHQGEIYMFASGLRDAVRAEQVLAEHEVTHYGLLGLLGKEGKRRVLQSIWARNARIRKQAHELGKRNKINYIDATEEILADMDAKELTSLSGWRGLVLALRDWFASHGFDNIARWMNAALEGTLSDQARADLFAADLVRRARAFVENGPPRPVESSLAAMLARAWHGTPHIWAPEPGFPHGRPRLDKMGTGEGVQAYGWGWYSAETKEVAGSYIVPPGGKGFSVDGKTYGEWQNVWHDQDKPTRRALTALADSQGNATEALVNLRAQMSPDSVSAAEVLAGWIDQGKITKPEPGSLYQLDIPDEVLPHLLDWYATLEDQPKQVRDALQETDYWKYAERRLEAKADRRGENYTGADIYRDLLDDYTPQEASEYLASLGIVGNRYLDGQSRKDGDGTYNYVIWDQPTLDKIALIERNGEKLDAMREDGAALSRKLADDLPAQEKWLNTEARMRGFKDIEDLLARDYPLFEKLAALWRKKHPAEAMLSRKATINVDGVERPTTNSNGQPIAQTVEGLRNFWRWFGSSRVVDDQGRPLVVYHGTNADFSEFNPLKTGTASDAGWYGDGFYFTPDPKEASEGYAFRESGSNVMPVYLAIKNPYDWRSENKTGLTQNAAQASLAKRAELQARGFDGVFVYEDKVQLGKDQKLTDAQKALFSGNDSSTAEVFGWDFVENSLRRKEWDFQIISQAYGYEFTQSLPKSTRTLKEIVAFRPEQIKSATGNRGTFDPANPDIRLSRAGQSQLPGVQRDMFQEDMIGPDATVETSRLASSKGDTELGVNVNSTGRQIAPTRQALENFWKWFGNSETVDDEGRPSLYYHTTLNDFEQFEANRVTANSGTFGDWETSRAAIFFTESLDDSQAYGRSGDGFAAGANVMPVYIRAENILDMSGGYLPSFGRDAFAIKEAGLNPRYMEQFDWSKFDDEDGRHMVDALKRAGYDGIKFWDENPHTRESFLALAVFDPGQIKSALGNRGTFDPANPDIRLSRAGQSQLPGVQQSPPVQPPSQQSANLQGGASGNQSVFNTPEPSKMDNIIFKLQDKHIDLKRAIQGITDAGRQIADKWNTYMQEELFHGRTAKRVQDFADRELAPMLREMALRKVSIADLDKYLWARHAKEANALIEQRDPGVMVDDATGQPKGSGMTDQEADDYFAGLSQDQRNQLDAIARKVDGMIARTRDLYVSYGLENRDTVQGWADMFQHYVPLMREDHDGGMGIGQGFSIKGREAKHRTGSTRAVADVLANIATQRERAIVRGEKNRVAVSLAGLVKLNQAPDFWTLDKIPQERVLNEKTGLVETREVPNYRTRDNVIIAKIKDSNGNVQERAIVLNENDERAVRLAKSMKNIDIPMLEGWLGSAAAVTRYFSAINTQYNPVFGVVNIIRDTGTGALNLSSTALKGKERAVTNPRRIASAVAGIYSDARKERKGQVGTSPWATLWEEFTEEGGQTGYRDMFRTSNERANAMQQVMDPTSWTENKWGQFFTANGALKVPLVTIQKAATPLFNWLSDFNLAMENAVRLSAYKEAVDSGMSKQQAASLAKNLTVNFNRKGAWGAQAGALYAFFNAATQGTARIGETLTRRDHVTGKYSVSGVGKKIIGGGVMLGVMQAVALAMAGYDDDEPPEFIRERNIVVPLMDGKYISIPMPLGFHVLPNIGRIATETLMGRRGSAIEGVIDLMGITFEAFNPMGSAGWSTQTVLPTVFDPMAAIIENKDWTGKPIAKEKFSNTDPEPGFAMAKDNASSVSTAIAYAINLATGGSEYTAGKISPTPDQIDYLWGQVTGGVGREGNKLYQSVESLFTGEELPPHKIPLAGRLYGNTKSSSAMNSRFYDNIRDMKRHKAEYMGRMEDGDTEGAQQYLADNPEAEMIRAVGAYESKVQQLRSAKRKAIEQGDSERAKEIEMMTGELMERFNQQIGSAKQ